MSIVNFARAALAMGFIAVFTAGCLPVMSLHGPAQEGDYQAVVEGIESGLDVNEENSAGETPWGVAVSARHPEIAKLLIARGAKPDSGGLRQAVSNNDKAMVELFIAHGAKVDESVLESALAGGHENALAALREAGHVKQTDVATAALPRAARTGDIEAAKTLLAQGADPNAKGSDGKSPIDIVIENGNEAMAELFLSTIIGQ